ncbi:MAG: NAD-dependent protein deacetylase [Pseudomonadota bacterium]
MTTAAALAEFVQAHPRLMLLTGAGVSTTSGIPDYQDEAGRWKRQPPLGHQDFLRSAAARRRYWARSMVGWPRIASARPNAAHEALARMGRAGYVQALVTQNVDGLHQRAGSQEVIELHGGLDRVICLGCRAALPRSAVQHMLETCNPGLAALSALAAPDGDAEVEFADLDDFRVPDCPRCGGLLKPDVVFFGDGVPRQRVDAVLHALVAAGALLVVGSSLMVYSGYRFCLAARDLGKPIAALNLGTTRADDLLQLKVTAPCGPVLERLAGILEEA